jgi:hypothetical protein
LRRVPRAGWRIENAQSLRGSVTVSVVPLPGAETSETLPP